MCATELCPRPKAVIVIMQAAPTACRRERLHWPHLLKLSDASGTPTGRFQAV